MANAQVSIIEIEVEGIKYTSTRPNYYYYKKQDGKQVRISKAEWELAFEEYERTAKDISDAWDAEQEIKERKAEQEKADKQTEKAFNKKTAKKESKPRRSKDIAFIFTPNGDESRQLTLTTKQVAFIKAMPRDDFYENGLDSTLWIDVFCDTVADEFSPMAVGAMVSTLREKNLITVNKERVNGKVSKYMAFTELGQVVAKELGL